jgi:beta-glucanase (GH16 family)
MKMRTTRKCCWHLIQFALLILALLVPVLSIEPRLNAQDSPAKLPYPEPVGQGHKWKLIFNDEFNGTSLNTSIWTPGWFGTGITGPVNVAETTCYSPSNVQLPGDGNLHLSLIQQSETCFGGEEPLTGALISSNPDDGVAGHVGFQYTFGYMEVGVYLPPSSTGVIANWPAAWSDGQSWPTDGENDTLEGLSGSPCFHFESPAGNPGGCAVGNYSGWHTFGSDWKPGSVTYYYDGVKVGEITTGITSAPQYLILENTQGSYGGVTVTPATMLVDYIRVWQKAE